jgi:DNA (cytosine-5)-methyltransferase 1
LIAYYNEIDPFAAAWLRELINAGHIAPGDVDERSIVDVRPSELLAYTQCHFFAGIGVWSHALRLAGWPDDRPVWTGSCPCQPFSSAGKGGGFDDERHLWPHFHWLIGQCRPDVVLGEQVASKDGLAWLDLVQSDLEGSGYASGAIDTCAAGFGAPHIRQRLYWVGKRGVGQADAYESGLAQRERDGRIQRKAVGASEGEAVIGDGVAGWLGDTENERSVQRESSHAGGARQSSQGGGELEGYRWQPPADAGSVGRLADANGRQLDEQSIVRRIECDGEDAGWPQSSSQPKPCSQPRGTSQTNGFWRNPDWLFCQDGKWRPVEPGAFPLAHGAAARVGRLRGYGNAINAEQAQAFIEAVADSCRQ